MSGKGILQAEIEAKFLDVVIEDVRASLLRNGAVLEHPMRLMRRVVIEEDHHAAENSFIRIRDEGDCTTLTFKRRTKPDGTTTVDSTQELETIVGSFDTAVAIFKEAGWEYLTFQESRRETWQLGEVEVVIDEWPWIKPYIEIEAKTIDAVKEVAAVLGFKWEDAVFGSVDVIYNRDYPHMTVRGVIDIKEVRFDDSVPEEFKAEGVLV
ncbi:MAG: CYTH domain-containing protein [Candidatus Microsaccharimonas sp.]